MMFLSTNQIQLHLGSTVAQLVGVQLSVPLISCHVSLEVQLLVHKKFPKGMNIVPMIINSSIIVTVG